MEIVNVRDFALYKKVDDVWVPFACQENASINVSQAVREIICKLNGGWKDFRSGIKEWAVSGSGLLAYVSSGETPTEVDAFDILETLEEGDMVMVRMDFGVTGSKYLEGTAIVQTFGLDSSGGDSANATYSHELQGAGPLIVGIIQ